MRIEPIEPTEPIGITKATEPTPSQSFRGRRFSASTSRSSASESSESTSNSTSVSGPSRSTNSAIWCKHWCKRSRLSRFVRRFTAFPSLGCFVRDVEVASSNLVTPTSKNPRYGNLVFAVFERYSADGSRRKNKAAAPASLALCKRGVD